MKISFSFKNCKGFDTYEGTARKADLAINGVVVGTFSDDGYGGEYNYVENENRPVKYQMFTKKYLNEFLKSDNFFKKNLEKSEFAQRTFDIEMLYCYYELLKEAKKNLKIAKKKNNDVGAFFLVYKENKYGNPFELTLVNSVFCKEEETSKVYSDLVSKYENCIIENLYFCNSVEEIDNLLEFEI